MEIHNNADVLKSLLNVGSSPSTQGAQPAQAAQATQKPGTQPALGGDKATVSALGAEAASAANSVRTSIDFMSEGPCMEAKPGDFTMLHELLSPRTWSFGPGPLRCRCSARRQS